MVCRSLFLNWYSVTIKKWPDCLSLQKALFHLVLQNARLSKYVYTHRKYYVGVGSCKTGFEGDAEANIKTRVFAMSVHYVAEMIMLCDSLYLAIFHMQIDNFPFLFRILIHLTCNQWSILNTSSRFVLHY